MKRYFKTTRIGKDGYIIYDLETCRNIYVRPHNPAMQVELGVSKFHVDIFAKDFTNYKEITAEEAYALYPCEHIEFNVENKWTIDL